ncbi:MAG: hypothetical protein ACHQHN_08065 [Sphingobacteriales bacterium]
MESYADNNGDSGISGYEIGGNYIRVQFKPEVIYEYTYASAGPGNIEMMKSLARSGDGLNSFINTNVKKAYSRRIS